MTRLGTLNPFRPTADTPYGRTFYHSKPLSLLCCVRLVVSLRQQALWAGGIEAREKLGTIRSSRSKSPGTPMMIGTTRQVIPANLTSAVAALLFSRFLYGHGQQPVPFWGQPIPITRHERKPMPPPFHYRHDRSCRNRRNPAAWAPRRLAPPRRACSDAGRWNHSDRLLARYHAGPRKE